MLIHCSDYQSTSKQGLLRLLSVQTIKKEGIYKNKYFYINI